MLLSACSQKAEPIPDTSPDDGRVVITPIEDEKQSTEDTSSAVSGEDVSDGEHESDDGTEHVVQNNLPVLKTLNVCTGLNTSSEFSGDYRITGYVKSSVGDSWSCTLHVNGVGFENYGEIDAKAAGLPSVISSLSSNVYLHIIFDGDNMTVDMVDKITEESYLGVDSQTLIKTLYPEFEYPMQDAGVIPTDTMFLSNYEPGKIYVFDSADIMFTPLFRNDTDNHLMFVSIIDPFNYDTKGRIHVPSLTIGEPRNDCMADDIDGKLYIAVGIATPEEFATGDDVNVLSQHNLEVGSSIERGIGRYYL